MLTIDDLVLKVSKRLVGDDAEVKAEFKLPATVERRKSFFEIGRHERMNVKDEILDFQCIHKVVKFFVQSVGQKERRTYLAFAVAGWTFFRRVDVKCRADALTRDLHESELAEREDVVTRTVICHHFAHVFEELLTMFGLVHVDKVDDDDATHVAQAQLPGYLVGGTEVDLKRVAFLIRSGFRTVAGIDIDDMEGFSMFDDYLGTRFERHRLSER